ncbi:type II toxin-antitoxin system Phd/YefM family antitoxin [Brachybacterium paraconglomeratum]|uniref:type II toxin-antitoxin system Phd/YefM family antitoxin n=2 Tax=Brachybacterium TaxID=43668 RepID=UPI00368BC9A8
MTIMSASEARQNFAALLETAQHGTVKVERRGEVQAVVLSAAEYERLLDAAEDAEDARAFDEAMAEEGASIPWEQVKRDLGW